MSPSPGPRFIARLLEGRAGEKADQQAYVFLAGSGGRRRCTYGELHRRASAIASHLRRGAPEGERILLLYPPGLDFIEGFLGCNGAGDIAVPAPAPNPLKPERSLARLHSILKSAQPSWALTTSEMLAAIRPALAGDPLLARMEWLATDELPTPPRAAPLPPGDGGEIAMIQYTSGSTADPKGAALSHENLFHNLGYFDHGWDHDPESILVNWLPAFHDLGLIYGILYPLWAGFPGIQMSPIDVIQRPFAWLKAISEHRATHSTGPNFIYELCVRKVSDADLKALDLSSWRMALTAAEPVRPETMARFSARFAQAGFSPRALTPGFGLSEGTCKVAAATAAEEPTVITIREDRLEQGEVEVCPPGPGARPAVGCGRPSFGVGVAAVEPKTRERLPEDRVGEIWVSGPSIAHSYWNQPAATEELLRARIAGEDGTPHLRTGDLGFLHGGQLFIAGRMKDVIIVRGSNHYPQDLEYTAQDSHPSIRPGCCAAFSYDEDCEERVALVAEVDPTALTQGGADLAAGAEEVVASIRRAISEEHGLRLHRVELIRTGTIPKTTSGKIQRQACKRLMLTDKLQRIG